MAEIAAGALVAEQVVSTGLEAGAAVSIAKPTQPLKATLSQIATTPANDSSLALARSHHTVTVVGNRAYIFGGSHALNTLCTTDIHALSLPTTTSSATADYACYPAFPLKDNTTGELLVPAPRQHHAACARPGGKHLVIHGGCDANGNPLVAEQSCLWLFDTDSLRWTKITPAPDSPRPTPHAGGGHFISFVGGDDNNNSNDTLLLLHDGHETWTFDLDALRWTQLPSCPAAARTTATTTTTAAFVGGALYTLSAEPSALSGAVHVLRVTDQQQQPTWDTIDFPANPLAAPGPKPRNGAALVPISTGYGRHYLVLMFGSAASAASAAGAAGTAGTASETHPLCSDVWALQVPSRGFNAAAVKDVIRDRLLPASVESGAYTWAEVEIVPTEQVAPGGGKAHPGPRAYVGASACLDGKGVVFWGGENAGGERESDGWLLKIE